MKTVPNKPELTMPPIDCLNHSKNGAYTFNHGAFLLTIVSDGYIAVPNDIVVAGADPKERPSTLSRLPATNGGVKAYANIPVVRAGVDLIIFDVGGGGRYQATEGHLLPNLLAAGISPAAITKVVLTHAHPDHVWGIEPEVGQLAFPNATYYIGKTEWNFWMNPDYLTSMPSALHAFARGTRRSLGAVKDRIVFLKGGDDVISGIRAFDTPGHTPGHLSYELEGKDGLLIAGDVATSSILSFEHPEWIFGFDIQPDLAIASRQNTLCRVASDRSLLLGYHWPYPGLGNAERRGRAYQFVPTS